MSPAPRKIFISVPGKLQRFSERNRCTYPELHDFLLKPEKALPYPVLQIYILLSGNYRKTKGYLRFRLGLLQKNPGNPRTPLTCTILLLLYIILLAGAEIANIFHLEGFFNFFEGKL